MKLIDKTMRRAATLLATVMFFMSGAMAQQLPSYYPSNLERTGHVDAVLLEDEQIVVNDLSYRLSSNLVVHAPKIYSIPRSRLRAGQTIAFRVAGERQIMEIWILPYSYDGGRGRR